MPHRREGTLSFGARPGCDVLPAASNFKPAPSGSCGAGASVLAVSREETQHSSLLRVRVVSRWLWSVRTLPKDAATARLSPPSSRPWCDVPAAASSFMPAPRGSRGAGAWTLAVSGDEAQHSSLLCVRAVPRSFWSVRILPKNAALARRLLLLSERARYGVSAAASSAKPAPCVPHGAGAQALAVSWKEAQHSTLLRARLAALVLVGVFSTKERSPDEMLLSFGARP